MAPRGKVARKSPGAALWGAGALGLSRLFGRERQRSDGRGRAELSKKLLLLGPGGLEVAVLDVAESADLLRDRREPDRKGVVCRGEIREDLVDPARKLADQAALHPPLP